MDWLSDRWAFLRLWLKPLRSALVLRPVDLSASLDTAPASLEVLHSLTTR